MYVVSDVKNQPCVLQAAVRCTQAVRRKSEAATEARGSCGSVRLLAELELYTRRVDFIDVSTI